MTVIEITEKKYDKLSEHIEESLRHLGKAMSCISEIGEPYGLGYRDDESMEGYREGYSHEGRSYRNDMMDSRYGMRSRYDNYGQRGDYGYRDDEWEMDDEMGERRRRSRRTGRYM